MHATSPTKLASPTLVESVPPTIGGVPTLCTNTMPIATSTPVNLPAPTPATTSDGVTIMAPPPLTVNSSAVRTSYPAVLKGRTAASPPVANLVPSGKVPPPVPPRGTGKRIDEHRAGNISSSSSTSGRGDVNLVHSLHDDDDDDDDDDDGENEIMMKVCQSINYNESSSPRSPLHAPLSSQYYQHSNYCLHANDHLAHPQSKHYASSFGDIPSYHELDEFVSIERVDDNYVIRTSPFPFRPSRKKSRSLQPLQRNISQSIIVNESQSFVSRSTESMQKFTQLLKPTRDNSEYKMSRKDKKYSNTYAECQRKKHQESIKLRETFSREAKNYPRKIVKPMSIIKSSDESWRTPLKKPNPIKVKIKSYKIKKKIKRVAPVPLLQKQVFDTISKVTQKSIQRPIIRLASINSQKSTKKFSTRINLSSHETLVGSNFSLKVSSPNIHLDTEKCPETLKSNMSDDQYEIYLKQQSNSGTLPSTCSTPPPAFDDAVRSNDQTLASGGHLQITTNTLTSNIGSNYIKSSKVHHVTLTKTYHDSVSISDVHLESSGSGSGNSGRDTKSSLSVESGGSSSRGAGGGLTWTPPTGSAEGSTPTWTEGTPSFTESSSSGDAGCPTTPTKGHIQNDIGGRVAATVEEALASLTTEMLKVECAEKSTTLSAQMRVCKKVKQNKNLKCESY
ncbi:hypothetical protein PV325_006859 [Microctonus aethiopoides]|nr:hypothetical protein PV325_006859 [Microctonus aethiopoides]